VSRLLADSRANTSRNKHCSRLHALLLAVAAGGIGVKISVGNASRLLDDIVGVGSIGAPTIIGYTRDVTRFPTRGYYALYNATASIEVSSGGHARHRLNLRGNRIVNHAIHIATVTQLRHDTNGRTYYDTKIVEGKTPKEAIRALRRRISDAVHRHLRYDAQRITTSSKKWVREHTQERL